jgi:tRNA U34 5-methylaminomethyl-2-thiouridine-forming methyltransferase MnmC
MKKIITRDGSETVFNETYQEHYHSTSGAVEETNEKYVKPCRIAELSRQGMVRVLDIGFGLGYNAIGAIDAAEKEIEVISLEKDLNLQAISGLKPGFRNYGILRELEYDLKNNSYLYEDSRIFLKIIVGDAVKTIGLVKKSFDAVFHDPFSPPKNQELWTAEFFAAVYRLMKPGAILATYSCARAVRDNLKAAGFIVKDGPIVGRRGPSTIAVKP